jgi:hypothetical protein
VLTGAPVDTAADVVVAAGTGGEGWSATGVTGATAAGESTGAGSIRGAGADEGEEYGTVCTVTVRRSDASIEYDMCWERPLAWMMTPVARAEATATNVRSRAIMMR